MHGLYQQFASLIKETYEVEGLSVGPKICHITAGRCQWKVCIPCVPPNVYIFGHPRTFSHELPPNASQTYDK